MNDFVEYLKQISEKWRKEWERAKLHEADVDESKPKFFITAAFPYPNSPAHLGHSRTYSITDAYARYKRMSGYNVLFPMGFHYTGTPIIAMTERLKQAFECLKKLGFEDKEFVEKVWNVKGSGTIKEGIRRVMEAEGKVDEECVEPLELLVLFAKVFELPVEDLRKITDPLAMANYFASITEESMKQMGYMIDWRRKFTTVDPDFQKFITWQFLKLKELGYIEKGTHPVAWDPVYNTPVSQHDTKGDVEPEIEDYDVILFQVGDLFLPAATLRAETVFGVTNVWLNPDVEYEIVEVEGKKWVLSPKAAYKIKYQKDDVKSLGKISAKELIGKYALNPATGKEVPILPAKFVDPNVATGVVMSVPAHAPFDYVALMDLRNDPQFKEIVEKIEIIPVIEVPGLEEPTAVKVVKEMGIKSQEEREKLEQATKEVYSLEYRKGRMREDVIEKIAYGKETKAALKVLLAKKPVPDARELTAEWLRAFEMGDVFYEIKNGPVYSRFGNEVVVKVLKDQWFINYGDPEWKRLARKALAQMKIIPERFRKSFEDTIEWLQRRACARTRGLGTPLPWDKRWIIESLSDSTIYMAFYTVNYILRSNNVKPEQLEPEVWDYILLGKGDAKALSEKYGIPETVLQEARRSFDYWYPVDSRHSGMDLIRNHLTFFIFNHAAIFPEDKWPRQIVVNGFVTLEGKKMSKSLGNIIPITIAVKRYSPDVVRLTVLYSAEIGSNADVSTEIIERVLNNLRSIKDLVEMVKEFEVEKPESLPTLDAWLLSSFVRDVEEVTKAMDELKIREATNILYFVTLNRVKEYLETLKASGRELDQSAKWVLRYIVERWIKMMMPFTPFFAEEMWHSLGKESFLITEPWPIAEKELLDPIAEASKRFVEKVIEDIMEILKVAKIEKPKKVRIEVAPKESYEMLKMAVEYIEQGKGMKEFMSEAVKTFGKSKAKELRETFQRALSLDEVTRQAVLKGGLDEKKVLEEFKKYIEEKVGAPVEISEYSGGKKKPSAMKVAIYVE